MGSFIKTSRKNTSPSAGIPCRKTAGRIQYVTENSVGFYLGLRLPRTTVVTLHKYVPDINGASAVSVHAGINQFLDPYSEGVHAAVEKKLVNLAEIDDNLRGVYRVMIRRKVEMPKSRAALPYLILCRVSRPLDFLPRPLHCRYATRRKD